MRDMDKHQLINKLQQLSRSNLETIAKKKQIGLKVKQDFGVRYWKEVNDHDLLDKITDVFLQKGIDLDSFLGEKQLTKVKSTRKPRAASLDPSSLEPIIVSLIQPYFIRLEKRIEVLETKILGTFPTEIAKTEFSLENFSTRLKLHYEKINSEERRGGMVPIPKLWDKLQNEGFNREHFNSGLFELERQRVIELQTASDPKIVHESDKAIKHPSRGLINYVIWRR